MRMRVLMSRSMRAVHVTRFPQPFPAQAFLGGLCILSLSRAPRAPNFAKSAAAGDQRLRSPQEGGVGVLASPIGRAACLRRKTVRLRHLSLKRLALLKGTAQAEAAEVDLRVHLAVDVPPDPGKLRTIAMRS